MEEREFVSGSRNVWERLAGVVAHTRKKGIASLSAAEVKAMHEDYRRTAADLAYAQTHFPGTETAVYLNRLIASAHGELYGGSPRRLSAMWRFLATGYPRLVRKHARTIALATLLLVGAVAMGYLLAYVNFPLARIIVPQSFRDLLVDPAAPTGGSASEVLLQAPAFSALITTNNVQVSLQAFAGGMTFGLLTVYALIMNGALLGVLAGAFGQAGLALEFWAFIVPHGALELPAIVLAGASGLLLAGALVFPADRTRGQALRAVSGDAVRLVLGAIPLLIIAGLIEGFVTPLGIDPLAKVAIGAAATAALAAYVLLPGRAAEKTSRD